MIPSAIKYENNVIIELNKDANEFLSKKELLLSGYSEKGIFRAGKFKKNIWRQRFVFSNQRTKREKFY